MRNPPQPRHREGGTCPSAICNDRNMTWSSVAQTFDRAHAAAARIPCREFVKYRASWPAQVLDGTGASLQSVAVPRLVAGLLDGIGRTDVIREQ